MRLGVAVEDDVGALTDRALDGGVHLLEVEVALDHGEVPAELVGLLLNGLDPPRADRRLVAGGERDDLEGSSFHRRRPRRRAAPPEDSLSA